VSDSPNSNDDRQKSSRKSKRRKSVGDIEGRINCIVPEENDGLIKSSSVQQLVEALADTNAFQKVKFYMKILKIKNYSF